MASKGVLLGRHSFVSFEVERLLMLMWVSILLVAGIALSVSGNALSLYQEQGRVMPAPQLKCDRNDLTLYDGKVAAYRRRKGSTYLRIRTNFDTTEDVTIRHRGTVEPLEFFLLNGRAFTKSDWPRIERKAKVLRDGMRANVWVCRGNPSIQPVVDWCPDDTGANPRSR